MQGVILLVLLVGQVLTQGDLDSVILDVFGTPPKETTTAPPLPATTKPPVKDKQNVGNSEETTCTTTEGHKGVCVAYYQCNKNNTLNVYGENVIDIRFNDDTCKSALEKCCSLPDVNEEPVTPQPPKAGEIRNGCGWRNKDGVGFKTTGDKNGESKFGEFPWTVAVLREALVNDDMPNGDKINVYLCGGSLIHPRVVLTAAHCVYERNEVLRIRAGEWDTQTEKEIYKHQDRDVERVIVHKDFMKGPVFYDFALLILKDPVTPDRHIGFTCLPQADVRARNTDCFVSGWGKDQFGKQGRYQVILKKVEVPVVANRECQEKLRETRLGKHFMLHHTFMCAGGNGRDTCTGDGGAPLVCPIEFEEERYEQYGIVAWGIGCGVNPAVYADVSQVRDWIDDKVIGSGFDTKYYTY